MHRQIGDFIANTMALEDLSGLHVGDRSWSRQAIPRELLALVGHFYVPYLLANAKVSKKEAVRVTIRGRESGCRSMSRTKSRRLRG